MKTKISKLKKGDVFKKPNGTKVYQYNGKPQRGYFSYHDYEDINTDFQVKKDIDVVVGFSF